MIQNVRPHLHISFLSWKGEMKYQKQAGELKFEIWNLKFEIKVRPKTFEIEKEKWNIKNKQVNWNLKFEIKVRPKTFETGERIIKSSWLTEKLWVISCTI